MWYIQPTPREDGGYSSPQSTNAEGLLALPDEFLEEFIKYNGFVNLTVENNTVVFVSPNTEAWEAWKATLPTGGEL